MATKERVCHRCGTRCTEWCPTCLDALETRRRAGEMTGDERAEELQSWRGPAEIPMNLIFQRIVELVGNPISTSELASMDALVEEARTWQHPAK